MFPSKGFNFPGVFNATKDSRFGRQLPLLLLDVLVAGLVQLGHDLEQLNERELLQMNEPTLTN